MSVSYCFMCHDPWIFFVKFVSSFSSVHNLLFLHVFLLL